MKPIEPGICVRIAGDVQVCVPDDIQLMTPYVLQEQEDWFEDEIKFIRSVIRTGDRIVDVGANYGVYTLTAAKHAGCDGRVWAFEPSADTAAWLSKSLKCNRFGNVEIIEAAVSSESGQGVLVTESNSELNRLGMPSEAGGGRIIRLTTLDEIARELGWSRIDFVKIDAEGHEARVIDGGRGLFAGTSPLVMFEIKAGSELDLMPATRFAGHSFRRPLVSRNWAIRAIALCLV